VRARFLFRALRAAGSRLAKQDCGAQMVEFAVALPLLVLFVVGIFDFSGAFTLKQKLTNVARDAARTAAADPSNDLGGFSGAAPASVTAGFQVVINYFLENQLTSCGLSLTSSPAQSGLTWTYTGSSGCPAGGLKIIINRGYYFPASTSSQVANASCTVQAPGSQTAVLSTCVTIQYAYTWRFGRVATLLGGSATLPSTITATSVAINEN
jgi:TadE-like protein